MAFCLYMYGHSIKVMRPAAWISPRCNISGSGLMHFEFLPTNDFISSLLFDELQEVTTDTSQSSMYSPKERARLQTHVPPALIIDTNGPALCSHSMRSHINDATAGNKRIRLQVFPM